MNSKGHFKHTTRNINLKLLFDNFGIKYTNKYNVDHLVNAIKKPYTIKHDINPQQYIGITLKWEYQKCKFVCSVWIGMLKKP